MDNRVTNPNPEGLPSLLQLLTDPENQPHQYVGDKEGLREALNAHADALGAALESKLAVALEQIEALCVHFKHCNESFMDNELPEETAREFEDLANTARAALEAWKTSNPISPLEQQSDTSGLREALAEWKAKMDAVPEGHENIQRGRSTYNWMNHAYHFFKQYLPAQPTESSPREY